MTRTLLVPATLLFLLTNLLGDSSTTTTRTVTKLADGVYEIRHPDSPDTFPQGNTTVIIGERDVLVVDSCYLPSSARQDIAQIRQWTNKPVRYLLNTHWHFDHTMGNGVYAQEFPGLAIVATTQTRKHIQGYNPGWFERFPKRADRFKKILETGKGPDGSPISAAERKEYETALAGVEPVYAEYKQLKDQPPTVGFDNELDIDLGNREIEIRHPGRGNTSGDAIVYLPKEKILVAGDLLDYPVPYLGGGYPVEEIGTLKKLAEYDAQTIVPGHGEVLHDKTYLIQVIDFMQVVVAEVDKQVYRIGNGFNNLNDVDAAVRQNIDVTGWRKKFAGDDADSGTLFDSFSLPGVIKAAYYELAPK